MQKNKNSNQEKPRADVDYEYMTYAQIRTDLLSRVDNEGPDEDGF